MLHEDPLTHDKQSISDAEPSTNDIPRDDAISDGLPADRGMFNIVWKSKT